MIQVIAYEREQLSSICVTVCSFQIPVLIVNTDRIGHSKTAFSDCLLTWTIHILSSSLHKPDRRILSLPTGVSLRQHPFSPPNPLHPPIPHLPCFNPVCGRILYNPEALFIP